MGVPWARAGAGQGAAFACLPTAHPAPAQAHVSPGNLGNLPEPPKQCGTVHRHRTQATAGKPHLHSERAAPDTWPLALAQPAQEMIDEADRNGDGQIDEDEFYRIMKKTSLF